jgi:hypothetical protein
MDNENDILWGESIVKVTIFFDNVRCIPETVRWGKTAACVVGRRSTLNSTTGMSH